MSATLTPADLADPDRYVRCEGVPILDAHTRPRWGKDGSPLPARVYDEDRLRLIRDNSNARAARGEPGVLLLGHVNLKQDHPETAQPPAVGVVQNYALGEWQGRPCLTADLYVARDKAAEAFTYPRRSVEVFYDDADPEWNYIDALSLIRRPPERSLGMLFGPRQKDQYALGMSPDDDGPPSADEAAPDAPPIPDPAPPSAPGPAPETPQEPAAMPLDPADLQAIVTAVIAGMKDAAAPAPVDEPADAPDADAAPDAPAEPAPADEPERKDDALDQMQARHRREMDQLQRANDARAAKLDEKVRVLEQFNLRIDRKAKLKGLQDQGFVFDLDSELEEAMERTPEQFSKLLEKIPRTYRQSAVDQPLIDTGASPRPTRQDETALTVEDYPKIARIMEQKSLPFPAALAQLQADRAAERA